MIYICIPTHNEQQTVGVVLWKLRQVLTDFPRDYQLLVADDASTDKTPDVLEPYTRVLPLTVIRSDARQGAAASLDMLLREAVRRSEYPKRDVIVTLQADFSDEPDDLVPLVKRLEAGADVAVGNKVSAAKEPRSRRFARSLARYFVRRQKWPEGVATPFDGYRAYRLYSVKRALEDRPGRRLIRYDGWAGNAELLRAVLPHARRVDVVEVDDRPDRLQRPRRSKPFTAALQVRAMAAGTEPQALIGVQELDRIATTTSRSRERAAATVLGAAADRGAASARTNGSRTRQGAATRGQERPRSRSTSTGRTRGADAGEARRPARDRGPRPQARSRKKSQDGSGAGPRGPEGEGRRRQPRTEPVAAAAAEEVVPHAPVEGDAVAEPVSRPKRKRRRRKRGGQAGTADATGVQSANAPSGPDAGAAPAGPGAPDAGATADVGRPDDEAEGMPGEKKRRRRGGRRGGRGRRKPRTEGGVDAGVEGMAEATAPPAQQSVPEPVTRMEND